MKSIRRKYYLILLVFMPALCALCIGLSLWAIDNAESVHAEQTYKQIYAIKKSFLKDTVHNVMRDLDEYRTQFRAQGTDQIALIMDVLENAYRIDPSGFQHFALPLLRLPENTRALNIQLANAQGITLFASPEATPPLQEKAFTQQGKFGPWRVQLGINEAYVDEQTKAAIRLHLHNKVFENESYVWVNEIIDFKGG